MPSTWLRFKIWPWMCVVAGVAVLLTPLGWTPAELRIQTITELIMMSTVVLILISPSVVAWQFTKSPTVAPRARLPRAAKPLLRAFLRLQPPPHKRAKAEPKRS